MLYLGNMKKQIFKIVLVGFIIFGFFGTTYAALNIDAGIDVPESCAATDTDGITHNYGSSYLAVCAFEKALSNGSISNMQLSNQYPSLGLFVTSINNVTADPNSQYWALYQNGNYASFGITQLSVATGDVLMFQLHDFSDNSTGDQVTLRINSLITVPTGSGSLITYTESIVSSTITTDTVTTDTAPAITPIKKTFDNKKALDFLVTQQKDDGSFGENLYTDWSALAFGTTENYTEQKIKLKKYLSENKMTNPSLTDYERRVMALLALGLNPYNINKENYIKKIIDSFDGKQFGDPNKDNDDVFALIILQNAGFTLNDKMISDDLNFILNRQKENGSWNESVDMTGAGIQALASLNQIELIKNSLQKAKEFLKQSQKNDGGWANVSSTAWAIGGILALSEKPEDWVKNNNTPPGFLALNQDADGSIKNENMENKLWQTAYILTALSGRTWNQIMQKFEKPKEEVAIKQESKKKTEEEKSKLVIVKNIIKKPSLQNTATVINALEENKTEQPKEKNWFVKLLEKIFSLF